MFKVRAKQTIWLVRLHRLIKTSNLIGPIALTLERFWEIVPFEGDKSSIPEILLVIDIFYICPRPTVTNDRQPFGMRTNDLLVAGDQRPTTDGFLCYNISAIVSLLIRQYPIRIYHCKETKIPLISIHHCDGTQIPLRSDARSSHNLSSIQKQIYLLSMMLRCVT